MHKCCKAQVTNYLLYSKFECGETPVRSAVVGNIQLRCYYRIIIVVAAHMRLDNVVKGIEEVARRFLFLDNWENILAVCVTHMDIPNLEWNASKLKQYLQSELEFDPDAVVVSGDNYNTPKEVEDQIASICKTEHEIDVTSKSFLEMFDISVSNLKVAK